CRRDTEKMEKMEAKVNISNATISKEQQEMIDDQKFWIAVNKAEAHFGLKEMQQYEEASATAKLVKHEDWMMDSFTKQLEKLGKLMQKDLDPVH
ncbi:MAG: hypothetical protein J0I84_00750, partial [Terrimonas sp.]|nr:hypothetical protein [Terrimonas sp.]